MYSNANCFAVPVYLRPRPEWFRYSLTIFLCIACLKRPRIRTNSYVADRTATFSLTPLSYKEYACDVERKSADSSYSSDLFFFIMFFFGGISYLFGPAQDPKPAAKERAKKKRISALKEIINCRRRLCLCVWRSFRLRCRKLYRN